MTTIDTGAITFFTQHPPSVSKKLFSAGFAVNDFVYAVTPLARA
jgi:hypothetical protein